MFNEKTLEMFKCGFPSAKDEHLTIKPIRMPCGHSICQSCVPILITNDESFIECKICSQKVAKSELSKVESSEIRNFVESNLKKLIDEFKSQFNSTYKSLGDNLTDLQERITANIEYIKDEVTTRVESIKIELDKLADSLKIELDEAKTDLLNRTAQTNYALFEETLRSLNKDNQESDLSNLIFAYNKQLKLMNDSISSLKRFNHQVTIKISDFKVDKSVIGDLNYSYRNQYLITDINNRLKSKNRSTVRTIDLNAFDICVTSNDNLITSNFNDSNVCLYDRNYNLVKQVNRLNNLTFKPYSVASDLNENKVYICDHLNNRVFMVDSDLNYVSVYGSSKGGGAQNDQFDSPLGIDFNKNFLYICDSRNKRIQKLTGNLAFFSSYTLGYLPWQIKIGNQLACIRQLLGHDIFFHDINTFQLKIKHSGHNGYISVINTFFYEYNYEKKMLFCYDQDGNMHDEIQTSSFDNNEFHSWSSIALINNQFVITSQPAKKLIII